MDAQSCPVWLNHITPPKDGIGLQKVLALDMVPFHAHTVQKILRFCENCHNNPKAVGLGIAEGKLFWSPSHGFTVDLLTVDGQIIPKRGQKPFSSIPHLRYHWSRFLDEELHQFHTVGHHLSKSRAFIPEEIRGLYREGVCIYGAWV